MIVRLLNGSLINVEKEDFLNDNHFYQFLMENLFQKQKNPPEREKKRYNTKKKLEKDYCFEQKQYTQNQKN